MNSSDSKLNFEICENMDTEKSLAIEEGLNAFNDLMTELMTVNHCLY